jgi:integral membrane protein (TIGR01906 family)
VKNLRLQQAGAVVAAVTTPWVIVAAAALLFLNPLWIAFDQDRSNVTGLTGYTPAQVREVTGSILSDLVFGPPNFDVAVDGAAVLEPRSRSHMADVRSVLMTLGGVALIAALFLLLAGFLGRGGRLFWRGVGYGATTLAGGVIVVGIGFALFFDQAFELFHAIFFPPGTYMFDSRTDKLVQLFPDQFWSETSVAMALAVLIIALGVALGVRRLVREEAGR